MFDIPSPFDIVLLVAALALFVAVVRRAAGGERVDLSALFISPAAAMPWPRGVQEEEPRPWRFEILDRRGAAGVTAPARRVAASPRRHTEPESARA